MPRQANGDTKRPLLFWLIRRVEVRLKRSAKLNSDLRSFCKVVRGKIPLRVECAPAFNYARDQHTTEIVVDDTIPSHSQNKVLFRSPSLEVDLRYVVESTIDNVPTPQVNLELLDLSAKGHLGPAMCSNFSLAEGQRVTFVFRICPKGGFRARIKATQEHADELGVSLESTPHYS